MKNNKHYVLIPFISFLTLVFCLLGATAPMQDPTRPPLMNTNESNTSIKAPQEFELSGIFIYPNYQIAIINNHPVKVGDKLDEYIVTAITLNTVELTNSQNVKQTLRLTAKVKYQKQ